MKFKIPNIDVKLFISPFTKKGLSRKLALLMLGVILVPILIIGFTSVTTSYNTIISKSKESYLSTTHSSGMYFDLIFKNIENSTMQLMSNNTLMKYYSETSILDDFDKLQARQDAEKMVTNVMTTTDLISGIYILTTPETSIIYPTSSVTGIYDFKKLTESTWYKKIQSTVGGITWLNDHKENLDTIAEKNGYTIEPYAVVAARPFKDIRINSTIGVIMFDISEQKLKETLQMIKLSTHGFFFLLTPDNKVISPDNINVKLDINSPYVSAVTNKISEGKLDGTTEYIGGKNSALICYFKSPGTKWTYVGVVPFTDLLSSANGLRTLIILIAVIFTLTALIIGIYFASKLAFDVEKATEVLSHAASGDLTVTSNVKRNDEIGVLSNSFNTMAEQIRTIIKKGVDLSNQVTQAIANVAAIASETSTASNEVARAIQEIAEGSSNQAQEANKITERVSNFGNKINNVVKASTDMEKLSENVDKYTKNGFVLVDDLNKKSEETNKVTSVMLSSIKDLTTYTKSIGKITTLLSNISEQTKLLALNASIEAAKAGDAGRGFSVVAAEIRKLADQSRNSTKDIEDMLRKITTQVQNTEVAATNVDTIIKEQITSVQDVSKAFNKISSAMNALTLKIADINNSIQEIDNDKNEIIYSIESISAISEETAASSEEVSASTQEQLAAIEELNSMAEKLHALAQDLEKSMEIFKV
ncbi:methyl-accepting chemotaxis protein [Caldicellulosiruptoraceae bacterium PP1]